MSRIVAVPLAMVVVLSVCVGTASAQGTSATRPNFGPYYRPQLSPYLNLSRGGDPGINYFLGTLPESERRFNYEKISDSLQEIEANQPRDLRLRSRYGDTGTYFGNTGGAYGAGGPRFGVITQPRPGEPVTRPRR